MRGIVLLMALLVPGTALAQGQAAPAWQALIRDQLQDFLAEDAAGAFADASPAIQRLFGTPGSFMAMVEQGYPPIWRSRAAAFLSAGTDRRGPYQDVQVTGQDGRRLLARYRLMQMPDGSWRIDGVEILPDVGV